MAAPMSPNMSAPTPKKTSPLVWILGIVGGLLVLGMIGCGIVSFLFVKTVQHAGFDSSLMKKNPGLAMTKMVTAMNPDYEVVSSNDGAGTVTVKEKSTGKTVTYKFDTQKNTMVIVGENGEEVKIGAAATGNSMPSWVPVYPGSSVEGTYSAEAADGKSANYTLKTPDAAEKVTSYYQDQLKAAGFNVTLVSSGAQGGMLSAEDADKKRTILVTLGNSGGSTVANIIVGEKK